MSAISLHTRPLALTLMLAAALGGCSTWSRRTVPAPAREQYYAGPVRLTRADGATWLLDNVTVGRDSVVGHTHDEPHARIAMPVAEVRRLEARTADPLGAAAVVVGTLAAVLAAWGALAIATIGTGS